MKRKLPKPLIGSFLLVGIVLSSLLMLNTYAKQPFDNKLPRAGETLNLSNQYKLCKSNAGGKLSVKTELFFGLSKPNGVITDAEFQQFLDREITPRFPDGLTLLEGQGQFRNAGGRIIVERSRVLILLYFPSDDGSHQKIEEIRAKYQKDFQQESVLRIDGKICADF
jgi:hypothetical protein